MKNLTELLGKPVLSLYESKIQGIIKDALFDKNFKKLKYLVLFEDDDLEDEKILKVRDIYVDGKNAVVIKNNGYLYAKSIIVDEKTNPINNECYSTSGEYQGKVIDVLLDESYNIEQIVLNNTKKVIQQNILTNGDDVLLVQDDEKIVRLSSFKSKTIKNTIENKNIKVEILSDFSNEDKSKQEDEYDLLEENDTTENDENKINDENQNKQTELDTETQNVQMETPIKIEPIKPKKKTILSTLNLPLTKATKDNFLIGRKVTQNIYSQNHELVIRKNTRITEKTIVTAKTYSVIKELSVFSE